jgi:hypothetical protein
MPAKLKISETDVQQAVVLMLELDGWRSLRTDPVSNRARATGFGEVGMPDYLFIRYKDLGLEISLEGCSTDSLTSLAQVLWVEFKAPGKKLKPHQIRWVLDEARLGALVMTCDEVDEFREWYKTSGLMRHQILS